MNNLTKPLLVLATLLPLVASATPISYRFTGVSAGPQSAGFNAADPGDTIEGVFKFDDSLLSGGGVFRLPPPNDNADRIEQESPDAFVTAEITRSGGVLSISTETVVRTTARPDLRYTDFDNVATGVLFGYDNLEGLGGFINLSFPGIALLDEPTDLVGASGEALFRTRFQVGTNVFNLFDIQVVDLIGGGTVPEPAAIALLALGLGALAVRRRRTPPPRLARK